MKTYFQIILNYDESYISSIPESCKQNQDFHTTQRPKMPFSTPVADLIKEYTLI